MESVGFAVRTFASAPEFLAAQLGAPEGCVVLDVNMPGMNGLEVVKQIRKKPELASLVIVMVTTETEMDHMAAALEAGANEYVMKPFTKEILVEKLQLVGLHP